MQRRSMSGVSRWGGASSTCSGGSAHSPVRRWRRHRYWHDLAPNNVAEILDGATELARAWAPVRHGDEYPWVGLANAARYELRLSELTQDLQAGERMLGQLGKVTERRPTCSDRNGMGKSPTPERWETSSPCGASARRRADQLADRIHLQFRPWHLRGTKTAAEEYHAATVRSSASGRVGRHRPALASAWQRIHDDAAATLLRSTSSRRRIGGVLTNLLGVLDRTGRRCWRWHPRLRRWPRRSTSTRLA